MDLQIPSFTLNKFLNSPEAGRSIPEMSEVAFPVVDLVPFVWPLANDGLFTTAAAAQSSAFRSGMGVYRIRGIASGFINNGANAGKVTLSIEATVGPNVFRFLEFHAPAATVVNPAAVPFDILLDLADTTNGNETGYTFRLTNPAAPTSMSFSVSMTIQRVI